MSTPLETAIICRATVALPATVTGEFMFMPGGEQSITPIGGGIGKPIKVLVDAGGASQLEAQRGALVARGKRPYFDFNHADGAASYWPEAFYWKESPEPGIYCRGEWTTSGKASVDGKEWRQFSPVFHVDNKRADLSRIVCRADAKPNMGGLVNDPAFHSILPLWAKDAGAASGSENQTQTVVNMTEAELAALHSRIQTLEHDLNALKAKSGTENDSEIRAKESELRALRAEAQLEVSRKETDALKAKNKEHAEAITARNKTDAEGAVKRAVDRGAIAAKDDKAQLALVNKATEDPSFLSAIEAMQGNPALGGRISPPNTRVDVQVVHNSAKDAMQAYSALVAKNAAIQDHRDRTKAKISTEMAAIYAADLRKCEDDWMSMPLEEAIKAADNTSAAVGTLAGTLVLQRNLPLLKFEYPMLQTLFTDFSDTTGLWGQTEQTRIPIKPAVTEYDPTLDANGRPLGFVVVTPAQAVDVPVTLSKHVGIPMIFGVQTLASTIRNLFMEQEAGAITALGGYFVNMATALMTAANYNAYKSNTDAAGETVSGSTTLIMASTANSYPGQAISGTGIPTGTRVRSITDSTHLELTRAATASASGLTITLNGGLVPTNYTTFIKALADFNFAALGELGAAFDNNEVPYSGRFAMLNASYYQRLAQDPTFNTFFAAIRNPEIIGKGQLPELNNFLPQKAPWFPTSSNRVGFAYHRAAAVLKARLPQDFIGAVGAQAPGTVTTVTDPDTRLTVLNVQRIDLVGNYAENRIEVMLGASVGDRRAGMVITSA